MEMLIRGAGGWEEGTQADEMGGKVLGFGRA